MAFKEFLLCLELLSGYRSGVPRVRIANDSSLIREVKPESKKSTGILYVQL